MRIGAGRSPEQKEFVMKTLVLSAMLLILSVGSVNANVTVLGGLTREIEAHPGELISGTIDFSNNADEFAYVDVYQTDYLFFADGRTLYGDPGVVKRSNASWISFSPSRVAISAGGTASVYYEITVPADTELSGSYWSVLMIEPVSGDVVSRMGGNTDEISVGIKTIVRYAVQIITDIGETGKSSIRVTDNSLTTENGKRILHLDIENDGERRLSPAVWADLYRNDGTYMGRFESGRKRIFPNCSVRHHIDLSEVPKGAYTALMIVDNGDDQVFGANYEVRLEQ